MFEHLQKLDPAARTSWLSLPEITPAGCDTAAVELRHAGEANKPYWNAMLRRAAQRVRQTGGRPERVDAQAVIDGRNEDRAILPKYVLVGWRNIFDKDGNPVECTDEAKIEFCEQVPACVFDRMRNHAADVMNYLDELDGPAVSPSELAKN